MSLAYLWDDVFPNKQEKIWTKLPMSLHTWEALVESLAVWILLFEIALTERLDYFFEVFLGRILDPLFRFRNCKFQLSHDPDLENLRPKRIIYESIYTPVGL